MKNLEVLEALRKSTEEQKKEQDRILNERIDQHLQSLNRDLKASFAQSLDSIQSDINAHLEEESINPIALKWKVLLLAFLCGMLTMMILSLIAWYLWIRPYQVSRDLTKATPSGQYIVMPKSEAIQKGEMIALPIR